MDVTFSNTAPTAELPLPDLCGRRIGPYLLMSELGRGGMGNVWLARRDDGQYDARVAVKLLAAVWLGRDGARRFRHEGMLLARLDHPNIARLLDAGVTEQGEPYLVLEYIEGQRVDEYCRKAGLGVRARIELFLDLLSAVAHAHRSLVVHRDIKPANVLVTAEGKAKLLDFGIGKLVQDEEELTRTGHSMLTPEYAAPEQLLGDPVTTTTDIYALGLLLYVILTERLPYLDAIGSPAELFRRITTGAMPLPSSIAMTQLRADAPPIAHKSLQRELRGDLDNIVLKAMHSAPEQRYQDVGEFAADLRRFLNHEPVSARANTTWYRVRKFVRRQRLAVAATAVVLSAATLATTITVTQALEARYQRAETRARKLAGQRFGDFLNQAILAEGDRSRPAPTMDERVERAAAVLEQRYSDDPKFVATLLVQLAERPAIQGATATPERLLQRSYELGEKSGDYSTALFARCSQARRAFAAGKREDGERFIGQVKARVARQLPDVDVHVECLMAESYGLLLHGDYAAAKKVLLEAKGRLDSVPDGAESMTYAAVYSYLTTAYSGGGEYANAFDVARRSAALERRIGRGDTSQHVTTLQNMATLRFNMGEVSGSLTDREVVNERMREFYEPDTMPPAVISNHALVLVRMDRAQQALAVIDPHLERVRRDDNAVDLLYMLTVKATAHLALRDWAAAERVLREAQPLAEAEAGQPNVLAQVAARRAELAFARNDAAKAREAIAQALEIAGYQTDHPDRSLARVLLSAGTMALASGAVADAHEYAEAALDRSQAAARSSTSSADAGESLLLLAKVGAATESLAAQRPLLERAVQCLTNGLGAKHSLTLEAAALLDEAGAAAN